MSEEATRSINIRDEASATYHLKIIRNDMGLTNLTLEVSMKEHRNAILARVYKVLKENQHIRELTLIDVDDLGEIDKILESNKIMTKLTIHVVSNDSRDSDVANLEAIRSLLKRGPQVELRFKKSGVDYANIADAIPENSTLTSLTLSRCLHDKCVKAICKAVTRCSVLSKLDLSDNTLSNAGANAIADMLRTNSTLTELVLQHTKLDGCLKPICDALKTNSVLKKLDLKGNDIGSYSQQCIAELLRENSTLTELCLVGKDLSHVSMFDALQQNTTLKKFEYSHRGSNNSRLEQFKESLALLIRRNSTLTELIIEGAECQDENSPYDLPSGASSDLQFEHLMASRLAGIIRSIHKQRYVDNEPATFEKALAGNQTLRVLDLSHSMLSYNRVEALGRSLKTNTSLIRLMFCVLFGDDTHCRAFCEGLKVNRTLKTLWIDETVWNNDIDRLDVGAIAIARALAVNTGLEDVTIKSNNVSTECIEMLAAGLERNETLQVLVLEVDDLDEDEGGILGNGLSLNSSLKHLALYLSQADVLPDSLLRSIGNMSLEELKIRLLCRQDQDALAALGDTIKLNTSLKRLWLYSDFEFEGPATTAMVEAYEDNATMTCEIIDYESGESDSHYWFYYRLNKTGRLSWPDTTFPHILWSRALALADMRSSRERPDLLFHLILAKPEMFKDHFSDDRKLPTGTKRAPVNSKAGRTKKARATRKSTRNKKS